MNDKQIDAIMQKLIKNLTTKLGDRTALTLPVEMTRLYNKKQ